MAGFGILPCSRAVDSRKTVGTIEATLLIQMRSLRPERRSYLPKHIHLRNYEEGFYRAVVSLWEGVPEVLSSQ